MTVVNAYQKAAIAVRRKILLRIDFLLNEYTIMPRNKQAKLELNVNQANTFIDLYPCSKSNCFNKRVMRYFVI